jgi:hypothetical protein
VDRNRLAQDRDKWRVVLNAMINLPSSMKCGIKELLATQSGLRFVSESVS